MSFALEPDRAFYLPLRHAYMGAPEQIPMAEALNILRPVLEDPALRKIGQNIKYDALVLDREGVTLRGIDQDTMVLSYLLEPNWGQHNLDKLALAYLHRESIAFRDIVGKGKNEITMDKAAVEAVTPYACQDADYTLALSRVLWPRIEAEGLAGLYNDLERPLIEILAEMERVGVRIDDAALRALSAEMERDLKRLEKEIHELSGAVFNINSPKQLGEILLHKLQLPLSKKTRGTKSVSTAVDVLEEMAELHPVIPKILEFRQWSKLKSTYADALPALINPETGRVHTSYNQTVASTGRLSSSDPNLQNIPARGDIGTRFRRAFVPGPGFGLLAADYSQIELRVLAHMAGDEALIETFRARPRRPRGNGRARLRAGRRPLQGREPAPGQDHQLQHHLRNVGLFPGQADRRDADRGPEIHRPLLRDVLRGEDLPGRRSGEGPIERVLDDPFRPQAAGARAAQPGPEPAAGRAEDRPQHAHPGHGGGPDEEGHDRRPGPDRREEAPLPHDPPGP